MLKKFALLCALAGCWIQAAGAAPIGWYQLELEWRDGNFAGQIFYDGSSPYRVLDVAGTLTDIAQVTPITQVWNLVHAEPEHAWISFNNAWGSDVNEYDASFAIHLLDLGEDLAIDMSMDNSLYDWSHDYAFYTPEQLDQSPLVSWAISPAVSDVPEPASIGLVAAGLVAAAAARRRKRPAT